MLDAADEKIRVICLERDILRSYYTTYVQSDNLAIGRMVGKFIKDYLVSKYHRARTAISRPYNSIDIHDNPVTPRP